jgi:hypothetical protein
LTMRLLPMRLLAMRRPAIGPPKFDQPLGCRPAWRAAARRSCRCPIVAGRSSYCCRPWVRDSKPATGLELAFAWQNSCPRRLRRSRARRKPSAAVAQSRFGARPDPSWSLGENGSRMIAFCPATSNTKTRRVAPGRLRIGRNPSRTAKQPAANFFCPVPWCNGGMDNPRRQMRLTGGGRWHDLWPRLIPFGLSALRASWC